MTPRSEEGLSVAARRMLGGNIGALPVVDESRNLVGIITVQDVLLVERVLPSETPRAHLSQSPR